jgi:phosphoglycolate phosphatase
LVIFDFDGTIADSFPWFLSELNGVAARWRFRPVAAGEEPLLRSMSAREILRHLRVAGWKLPLVARDLRRRMAADIEHIRPFPGVEEALRALSGAGVRLGLATSNGLANVRAVLGDQTLALMDLIETGASVHGKGGRLRRMLRAAGLRAGQVLYVGDEIRDAEAARAAGIAFAAVSWGYNSAEALRQVGPALVFQDVAGMAERLGGAHPADLRAGLRVTAPG